MTPLRQQMLEDMAIRNYAKRTQQAYLLCVRKFAEYHKKSPELLGPDEVRRYQVYLARERKVSFATLNCYVASLRFLYGVTLKKPWPVEMIPYAKTERRLPVILSPEEVSQFFRAVTSLKYRTILATIYGAGLRVSEVAALRGTDIDSKRLQIRVEGG